MAIDLFDDERSDAARVQRLKNYHHSRAAAGLIWAIALALAGFVLWAMFSRSTKSPKRGEVIASSRVQVIQSVDGGVLSELNVREGDRVRAGQLLAGPHEA
jgi:adhesin transport system membrane fusion protein